MRNAFAAELVELARENQRLVFLSGDIGNRLFNPYKDLCPERFFNCGVAEANMTSMAAGLAMGGLRPVTYTIASFNTIRCLEQIKLDICYHKLSVVIVGVGAGLSYANLGATHHSTEDMAVLRVMPNLTIVCPADALEVRLALRAAVDYDGPVYLRLGKKNEPAVYETEPDFKIGKGILLREGSEVCLLSCGNIAPVAIGAARQLKKDGVSTQVVDMHTLKPLDLDILEDAFEQFKIVATLEEHSLVGGFGSAVAEWLVDGPVRRARLLRFGVPDVFLSRTGGQDKARQLLGLTPEGIAGRILGFLRAGEDQSGG